MPTQLNDAFSDIDILIMRCINDGCSIRETAAQVGRSIATVHGRMVKLEEANMVVPPPARQQHRNRKLTENGVRYLTMEGILKV